MCVSPDQDPASYSLSASAATTAARLSLVISFLPFPLFKLCRLVAVQPALRIFELVWGDVHRVEACRRNPRQHRQVRRGRLCPPLNEHGEVERYIAWRVVSTSD